MSIREAVIRNDIAWSAMRVATELRRGGGSAAYDRSRSDDGRPD